MKTPLNGGACDPAPSFPLRPHRRKPSATSALLPHLRAGSGPPVVLLPGLGPQHAGSHPHHRALQRLEVRRLARSFTVFILARPTKLPKGTTIKDLADRYASTITAHFPSPVDLIGVSTGGSIALQLAIEHHHATNRIVLVSAAFRLGDEGRTAQQAIAQDLRLRRPRRAAATMLATTTTRPGHRTLRRATGLALGRLVLGQESEDLIAILEAEDHFDVHADLARVTSPTLVIGGGQDGYYPSNLFAQTAANVVDGNFVELADKSHLSPTDRAVARTINDFLTSTSL